MHEMTEHLGHEKNGQVVNETGNVRNGSRPKTVLTEGTGQVGIEVLRDRDGARELRDMVEPLDERYIASSWPDPTAPPDEGWWGRRCWG